MAAANSQLLEVVGQLHEGVVADTAWQRAVGSVCEMLAIPRLLVGTISHGGTRVEMAFGHRAAPHAVTLLEGPLAEPAYNPWLGLAQNHPLRRVATVDDLGGQKRLEETRVWSDFYVPFGIREAIGAPLERQPEYANVLIAGRRIDDPPFGSRDRAALQALLPHIARSWRVKRALVEMEALAGSLKSVLDRLERAVVIAGPDGHVRFANGAADRLLTRGTAIGTQNGRMRASTPRLTQNLREIIERAAATAVGAGATAVDAVSLPFGDTHPSLAVVAEPLAAVQSECLGHASTVGAILFIGDSEASNRPPIDRLRVVYGLSPAEAKLTSLVVAGQSLTAAAQSLDVSLNTVKYHLKSVFEKVGVSRQTQLVRRVLADVGGLAEPDKMRPALP